MTYRKYYIVSDSEKVRFASVDLKECQAFATNVFKNENVVCEITEISK